MIQWTTSPELITEIGDRELDVWACSQALAERTRCAQSAVIGKRPAHRVWTLDEEAELRLLWADGVRGEALAIAFGRSARAVHARAELLGLTRAH